jgi:Ca2+-binding RTX toxin-like protein
MAIELFNTLNVSVGTFATIQDAVNAALDGYRIHLDAGTYAENVTVNVGVKIEGPNAGIAGNGVRAAEAVVDGSITVTSAAAVTIDGIKILHDDAINTNYKGIALNAGTGHIVKNTLFDSTITDSSNATGAFAVYIGGAADGVTIQNNAMTTSSATPGKFGTAHWARGIWSDATSTATVSILGNEFKSTRSGINLEGYSDATYAVTGNIFKVVGTGISVGAHTGPFNDIASNIFQDSDTDLNFRNLATDVIFNFSGNGNTSADDIPNLILLGSGNDTVSGSAQADIIHGNNRGSPASSDTTADTDNLSGLGGGDFLYGRWGADTLNGGDGDDILYGGDGGDTLNGGNNNDIIYADAFGFVAGVDGVVTPDGTGNDIINGDAGDDVAYGGAGADQLNGGADMDVLLGEAGADTFNGGTGNDYLLGGGDTDTAVFPNALTAALITDVTGVTVPGQGVFNGWNVNGGADGIDFINDVEIVQGSAGRFLLVGNGGFDTIQAAVDASIDGDTILIATGTYSEQVVIDSKHDLTLRPATGATVTIMAPGGTLATTATSPYSGRSLHGVVTVIESDNVVLQDLTIDGNTAAANIADGAGDFEGVAYINSSGGLENVDVLNVRDAEPLFGLQRGNGVLVLNSPLLLPPALTFFMHNSTVSNFQKNGVTIFNAAIDVSGNTVTGVGVHAVQAQNGIQIGDNITGSIVNNTITGLGYAPAVPDVFLGSGILILGDSTFGDRASTVAVTDNTVTGASATAQFMAVYTESGVVGQLAQVYRNTLSNALIGIYEYVPTTFGGNPLADIDGPRDDEPNTYTNVGTNLKLDSEALTALPETQVGTIGHDVMEGGAGADTFSASGGPDILRGRGGIDNLIGGAGNDTIFGGDGGDTINGGDDVDVLLGDSGNDILNGDAGADYIYGGGNDDTVNGGAGIDVLVGGLGVDTMNGGSELDYLYGDDGNDILNGDGGDDIFIGGAGDDTMTGGEGNDTIYAGSDADTMYGGNGADLLIGEGGNDIAYGGAEADFFYGNTEDDNLNGDGGNDIVIGGTGSDTLSGGDDIDNIYGEEGNDTLNGDAGNDILVAGDGEDTMNGGADNDYLYGGNNPVGIEYLYGGAGVDVLLGENGADNLEGGADVDYLFGGAGDDHFIVRPNESTDVVLDFVAGGAEDSIRFVGTGFSTFAEVQAAMIEFGAFTIIPIPGATSQIWVAGVLPAAFTAADFGFTP